nr:integrase, catalytic region, zinc finger, CCHC-type, peptidase aspartic, catalytic [Tanacetum cinerariifolium]
MERFILPSESEDIPENMCDVPFRDNSPPLNISKDQFKDFSDSNDDSTSIDDDYFSIDDIDYVEASSPNSELVSLEEVKDFDPEDGEIHTDILLTIKDDILHETLLNINLLNAKIKAFKEIPLHLLILYSKKRSDNPTSYFDLSLPDYEAFFCDSEPDSEDFTMHVVEDIFDNPTREPRFHVTNVLPTHPTFHLDLNFTLSSDSLGSDLVVSFPSGTRNNTFDLGIFFEVQSKNFLSLDTFYILFIHDPLCLVIETLLLFSSENKDKIFNPGTRIEGGFEQAFATLFEQDVQTFTRTMLLNLEQLEKHLSKEEFQELESFSAFRVLLQQFQTGTKSDKQDTSNKSRNDTHAEGVDIKLVNDRETIAETIENVDLKAQIQEKVSMNVALKNELRKLKGNIVDTKFAKPSILGKPILQPPRNQSVVRKLNVFKFERPNFSKPWFASQVDVNYVWSKPITLHYFPKVRECVFVKPHHVIASGSSRNSSKELYGLNDMAYYYYLYEAKKKTKDKNMNLKPSVMPTSSLQNTTNGEFQLERYSPLAQPRLIVNPQMVQMKISLTHMNAIKLLMSVQVLSAVPIAAAPKAVDLADSPMSTSIDQDTPSTSIPSTQEQEHSPNIPQGFEESPKTPTFPDDPIYESLHEDSNSQGSSSKVRQTYILFEHLGRWTKDHPIANVIGVPSRSVSSRKQLQTDAMLCYFDAFLTSVEPKNFKQAMTKP